LGDRAEHAVVGAAHRTITRPQRGHRALLVDALAEPLGDAALPGAGGAHQDHQAVRRPLAVDDLVADLPEDRPDVLATHEGALSDTEQAGGALGHGAEGRVATTAPRPRGQRARLTAGAHPRQGEAVGGELRRAESGPLPPG